jgi:mannose-6-phosphate isomerase-like protein (cupin superfamily)
VSETPKVKVFKFKEAEEFPAPPPSKKVSRILVDPVLGSKNAAIGVVVYPPGEKGAMHSHDNCEEYMFILKGKARVVREDGSIEVAETYDLIYAPLNAKHSIENAGNEDLVFVWIYVPPGEEKKIRERKQKK